MNKIVTKLLQTALILAAIYPPESHSQQLMKMWFTPELYGWYNPHDSTAMANQENKAEIDTISKQLNFYQNLGYSHAVFTFQSVYPGCIACDNNGLWRWVNDYKDNQKIYFKHMIDSMNAHHFELIPFIQNPVSHNQTIIHMHPRLSVVQPVRKLLYLKTNSKIETNKHFKISLQNLCSQKISVYIAYDQKLPFQSAPQWLKKNFVRVNTNFVNWDPDNGETVRLLLENKGRYNLFVSRSPLHKNDIITLGKNSNDNQCNNMYLVFFAGYEYSPVLHPDSGNIRSDFIKVTVDSSIEKNNWNNIYKLDTIDFAGKNIDNYAYGDISDNYKISKSDNFCDISGILSFIPYIRNLITQRVLNSDCSALDFPVKYNHVVKISNHHDSFEANSIHSIFQLYCDLLRECYVNSYPKYIGIGHDELGYDQQCLIFSKDTRTASEIIADQINQRIIQIDNAFPQKNIKVMLWGDSFVKNDWGADYGLIGDTNGTDYGKGGVLWILKNFYNRADRLVICPWRYNVIDGDRENSKYHILDKYEQIRYLDKLGIDFLPVMGDEADIWNPDGLEKTKKCSWEWIRAGEAFPIHRIGYGHSTWHRWEDSRNNDQAKMSQFAPIIPYLIINPHLCRRSDNLKAAYNPSLFSEVNFLRCRKERAWIAGIHY